MVEDPIRDFTWGGRCLAGPGALARLPELLDPGRRWLVVTDPGLAAAGVLDRVTDALRAARVPHAVFAAVEQDPTVPNVEAALAAADAEGCDAVIGLGGGSALDAAKALAARLAHATPLREYGDGLEVPGPIAPLAAIPTTAGTGSEATRVAVIGDPATNEKMALRGDALLPAVAILDPELLTGLPAAIAAECGADALTHAVEAHCSRLAGPVTDALALAAVAGVAAHLPAFVADRGDLDAGLGMLAASHLAGRAFTYAGLGLVHSLGEPLGAFHHLRHGLCMALFLPAVMDFNREAVAPRLARLARALGADGASPAEGEAARAAVAAVRRLLADVGLPASYAAAGIDFSLRPEMVDQVFPQFSTRCNPREASRDEVEALYLAPAG